MRKLFLLVAVAAAPFFCSGCASPFGGGADVVTKAMPYFYKQQRVGDLLTLNNVNEIYLSGKSMNIKVSTQLEPLSMVPRNDSGINAIESIARTGLGVWGGTRIVDSLSKRPSVVNPEVIKVPEPVFVGQ